MKTFPQGSAWGMNKKALQSAELETMTGTLVGTGCGTCTFVLAPSQDSKCLQYHNIRH
jgi:hypothetical protein